MIKRAAQTVRCFFEWPLLWTRIATFSYLAWAMWTIDKVVNANINKPEMVNSLLMNVVEGLMSGVVLIIGFYMSRKAFEVLVLSFAAKFGVRVADEDKPKKKDKVDVKPPVASDVPQE